MGAFGAQESLEEALSAEQRLKLDYHLRLCIALCMDTLSVSAPSAATAIFVSCDVLRPLLQVLIVQSEVTAKLMRSQV